MVLPVIRQALVECSIFVRGYVLGIACPQRLSLVQFLVLGLNLLHLLLFLLLTFLLVLDFNDLVISLSFLLFLFLDFLEWQDSDVSIQSAHQSPMN